MRAVTPLSPLSPGQRTPLPEPPDRRKPPYVHTRVTTKHQSKRRQRKRASQDRADRKETKRHLIRLAREVGDRKLADKLTRCHSRIAFLTCGQHLRNFIPNYTCEFRLCPNCGRRQAKKKLHKYEGKVYAFSKTQRVTPCHLVLTQERREGESLSSAVDRLMTAFNKLRRRSLWLEHFKGGLWSLEFTWDGKAYHVHLHLLVFRSKFIDTDLLRSEWAAVGGGQNLRLDRITDLRKGLREVLKYIAKPVDIATFTAQNLKDVKRMKGKRFFGTFGEFYSFSRDFEPEKYAHILTDLETGDSSELREGDPCPDCGEPMFQLQQNEDELIAFLRRFEGQGQGKHPPDS